MVRAVAWLALLLMVVVTTSPVHADDFDAIYFEQLRARGLFTLAESLCRRSLQNDDLPLSDRSALSIELARSFAAHARSQADAQERLGLWNAAHSALKSARERVTEFDMRLELAVQDAVVSCDHAEFDSLLAELNPYDHAQQTAVETLRQRALLELEQLEAALQETLSRPQGIKPLTLARLKSLQKAVLFQSGELLVAQGRALPRSSPDRSSAWLQAEQKLKRVAGSTADERVVWLSQISLARLIRLKNDFDRAEAMLKAIERDEPPTDLVDELMAERIELLAASNRGPDAADSLRAYRKTRPEFSARLAFLSVRTWLELSQLATAKRHTDLAEELRTEARRTIDSEPSLATGYWAHRARLVWDQFEEARKLGDGLARLLQEARGRYAAGDVAAALNVFQQAFDEAAQTNRGELSFEIGLTLTRLMLEQRRVDEALTLLDRMLQLHAEHARVGELDLLRAICLGRRFQIEPTKARREAYESALAEHVERYVSSPTAADAAWMAAQLKEKLMQYEAALGFYGRIPAKHARETEALAAAARCYRRLAERSRSSSKTERDWSSEALPKLTTFANQFAEQTELSAAQAEFLSHTAFMAVTNATVPTEASSWTRRLTDWMQEATNDDETQTKARTDLHAEVLSLRVLLVVRHPSAIETQQRIAELKTVPTTNRLLLLKTLNGAVKHLSETDRRAMSAVVVGAFEHAALDQPQPSVPTQIQIESMLAVAYETLGDAANAQAAQRRKERLKP